MLEKLLKFTFHMLFVALFLLGLWGCSVSQQRPVGRKAPTEAWDSYKCVVVASDYQGTGWATDEETARRSALEKCHNSGAAFHAACHIKGCYKEAPSKSL